MNPSLRSALLLTLSAVLFAGFGFWLGTAYGVRLAHTRPDPHERLHHVLDLSDEQIRQVAPIEAQFSTRQQALRTAMDAADHDLANAFSNENSFGPAGQAALARYYRAAQELREASIQHAFAMRTVLNSNQLQKFDFEMRHAWAAEPP